MPEKTYRISAERSDGKNFTLSIEYLGELLGLKPRAQIETNRFNVLWRKIEELEEEIEALLTPKFESLILAFVKENPDVQTRQFTYKLWRNLKSRVERGAYDKAFKNLEGSGKIIATSHGSSKNRTWRIANE